MRGYRKKQDAFEYSIAPVNESLRDGPINLGFFDTEQVSDLQQEQEQERMSQTARIMAGISKKYAKNIVAPDSTEQVELI